MQPFPQGPGTQNFADYALDLTGSSTFPATFGGSGNYGQATPPSPANPRYPTWMQPYGAGTVTVVWEDGTQQTLTFTGGESQPGTFQKIVSMTVSRLRVGASDKSPPVIPPGTSATRAAEVATSLSTVGAGTITAAGIVGGVVQRSGSQSNTNFSDTTDTAANIIAALPTAQSGQSWEFTYENQTNAAATLANGLGVTVSGITVVPPGTWARYLVTVATATTVTVVGFASGPNVGQQPATRTGTSSTQTNATNTLSSGVLSDLTVELTAGQKVSGLVALFANNSTAGEGLKFDLNGGTATWTSIEFGFAGTPAGATVGTATSTAIGTAVTCSSVSTSDACYAIAFAGVVNAAGTLVPRFAENSAHTSGTATVEINGYLRVDTTAN